MLRGAAAPVLLVPHNGVDIVNIGDSVALTCGPVVAAVDLTEHCDEQLQMASELAYIGGQPLILMTVAKSRMTDQEAGLQLRQRGHGLEPRRPTAMIVGRGNVAEEIARCAGAEGAGLVVMGLRASPKSQLALMNSAPDTVHADRFRRELAEHDEAVAFLKSMTDSVAKSASTPHGKRELKVTQMMLEEPNIDPKMLGSIAAPSGTAAVERLIDVFAPARRPQVRALLAGILRGVVTQALVRDKSGARVAARELLLSSPAVRQLIADGEFARLDSAIEAGRAHGMMTLASMLLALVRDGHVEAAEARRHAPDREAFTSMLRRAGLDSSSGERLA